MLVNVRSCGRAVKACGHGIPGTRREAARHTGPASGLRGKAGPASPPPPGEAVPLLLATARPFLPLRRPARAPSWHARAGRGCRGAQPPLTFGIEEIVDWAWFSAACGDAVPVIAAWMAVQMAWDTFG
jgi:hypothetical protein